MVRRSLAVCLLSLLAALLLQAENRMLLLLHVWLPCIRFLPSSKETLVGLLQVYFHFERTWSPKTFEADEVPEIRAEEYSLEKLHSVSEGGRKPVLIRGFVNGTKAFREAGRAPWVERYKDFNVLEFFTNKGNHYKNNETSFKTLSFQEYVQDIQEGKGGYGLGFDEMLTRYPELYDSLGLEQIQQKCRSVSLMVNGGGEGLKFHNENHPNFVSAYHGSKTWEIISVRFSVFLGPLQPPGSMSFGYLTTPHEILEAMFQLIPKSEVVLEPGDSLYNPAWSWHNIKKNTADEETKLVVMSACRWTDMHRTFWLAPALELYKSLGMDAFLHPSVPLWLRWIPFFRVGQDSFRQAFSLIPSFGEPGYDADCFSCKAKACESVLQRTGHGVT